VARFDRTIPPGGEGKITLEVKTKGFQGNVKKTARVFSNDPKNPQVTIAMKGNVWTPIQMKPRSVRLNGSLGDKIERVVHLEGKKKDPLILKLTSVSIPDKVEVQLKEVEKGRNYQLTVKNIVKEQARYRGQIKLTTNYPEKSEIVIQVSGYVRAPVEARPKVLNFGRMSKERVQQLSKGGRAMRRPVTVVSSKGNLKIEKVELEKSLFKVVTKERQPGRVFQLMVEPILEKLKKGKNTDRLRIYTNHKDIKVLEVPIRFEIVEKTDKRKTS
jgi:hypothetical protein